jgi:hypothetical protein
MRNKLVNQGGTIEVQTLDKKDTCIDLLELPQFDYKGNVLFVILTIFENTSLAIQHMIGFMKLGKGKSFLNCRENSEQRLLI